MKQYIDIVNNILDNGVLKPNRTGIDTISVFDTTFRHNMQEGFPLLTTKKMFWHGIKHELLWNIEGGEKFADGSKEKGMHTSYLKEHDINIWDRWADDAGHLGPIYGHQWRDFNGDGIDQLAQCIETLKTNPNDRRIIVTAWNPSKLHEMKLPPCHLYFQFYVANDKLSLSMVQRSCDFFLGVPFDIAMYGLLLKMVAQVTDLIEGELICHFLDSHIYVNHIDQMKEQVNRIPCKLPIVRLPHFVRDIDNFINYPEEISLLDYKHHAAIKGKVAV